MQEKKGLHPAIACAIMVVMLCCALLMGANKGWTKEKTPVDTARSELMETVQARIETAYNLLTVAGRYMSRDDALYAAMQQDLTSMEKGKENLRMISMEQFSSDAKALLSALSARPEVQSDSRDFMYVSQMLPQAVEQCLNGTAAQNYNAAAQHYNDRMNSFSGLLARLTGVKQAALFTEE